MYIICVYIYICIYRDICILLVFVCLFCGARLAYNFSGYGVTLLSGSIAASMLLLLFVLFVVGIISEENVPIGQLGCGQMGSTLMGPLQK